MAEHNASEAVEVLSSSEEGSVAASRRIEPAELALLVSVFVVAACGLAQGMDLPASVAPFILRGVVLAGVDSVYASHARRAAENSGLTAERRR